MKKEVHPSMTALEEKFEEELGHTAPTAKSPERKESLFKLGKQKATPTDKKVEEKMVLGQ